MTGPGREGGIAVNESPAEQAVRAFESRFGAAPEVVAIAPGRVHECAARIR